MTFLKLTKKAVLECPNKCCNEKLDYLIFNTKENSWFLSEDGELYTFEDPSNYCYTVEL
jgi:hypothetical protein